MKKTLLEIVQIILSKMDSDEVNSIGDTTESLQVAQEVETTFNELMSNWNLPERGKLISFDSLADPDNRPNYLKAKDLVDNIEFLMYNIGTEDEPDYKRITYMNPKDFLLYVVENTQGSSTMVVEDFNGAKFPIKTDQHPNYYTTFDDTYFVFDAFNSTVDDTLQESKAFAFAQVIPEFSLDDDYVPEIPAKYFPLLISEAASMCFINHKQAPNSKEEQRSRRQMVRHQNNRRRTDDAKPEGPDYGRAR
jgi:hypothetical protein